MFKNKRGLLKSVLAFMEQYHTTITCYTVYKAPCLGENYRGKIQFTWYIYNWHQLYNFLDINNTVIETGFGKEHYTMLKRIFSKWDDNDKYYQKILDKCRNHTTGYLLQALEKPVIIALQHYGDFNSLKEYSGSKTGLKLLDTKLDLSK